MSIQREIVQRLFESRDLHEAEFQAGGSRYYCAFGKYYKDGEQISREDYFKAKESGSSGEGSPAPVKKSLEDTLSGFEKHGDYGYSKSDASKSDVASVSQALIDQGYENKDYDDSEGEWWKFSDKNGNEVEVVFDGGYMEVNKFPAKKNSSAPQRVPDYGIDYASDSEYIRDYAYYKSELEAGDDWQAPYSLKYFETAAKELNCSPEDLKEIGDVDSMEKELYDEEDEVEFDYDKLLSQIDDTVESKKIDMGGVSATVNTMKDGSKIVVVGEEGLAYVRAK